MLTDSMRQMTDSKPMEIQYWNKTFYEFPGALQKLKMKKIIPQSSLSNYIKLIITVTSYWLYAAQFTIMQYCVDANFLQLGEITTRWDIPPIPLYVVDSFKMKAAAFMLKKAQSISKDASKGRSIITQLEFL